MPRIKRSISGIKLLTDDEKSIIDEFINSNESVKKAAEELSRIFKAHFRFQEEEIKLYIYNICEDLESEVVFKIRDICKAFEKNDVSDFDDDKRKGLARGVFDDIIALFKDKVKGISESFEDVLDRARTLHIDPFKLAIKTNLEKLTEDRFEETINALTQEKYFDSHKEEYKELFTDIEFKQAIEQCATLANQATRERVGKIFSLLNNLFWDENSKAYVYDVREIIKSAPSILNTPPTVLENTIEMLKDFYEEGVGGRAKLLYRLKTSPTILTVDFDRVTNFNTNFAKAIENIVIRKKNPTAEQKNTKGYSLKIADKMFFDINKLTQMDKLKTENLTTTANILAKYLGVDNAITCMQNISILQTSPQHLELTLASIVKEETTSKINLREAFVESPARILTQHAPSIRKSRDDDDDDGDGDGNESERGKKEKIVIADFPEIFVSNEEFENIKRKAGNKTVGLNQKLIDKLIAETRQAEAERKAEEARLAKERAEAEARYKEEQRAERQRKKEEEREKKRLAKKMAKESRYAAYTQPSQEPVKQELTLKEKQAIRRSKIPPIPDIDEKLSILQKYVALCQPFFDAFVANKYFPNNVPRFSKIKEAIECFEIASMEGYETSKAILEFSSYLKDAILNENGTYAKKDLIHELEDGKLENILNKSRELFEAVKLNNKKYNKMMFYLRESCKKNSAATQVFKTKMVNEDNVFMKYLYLKNALSDFTEAVENEAEEYFGEDYVDIFAPEKNKKAEDEVRTFFEDSNLNLNSYSSLIYDIYLRPFHEIIFLELKKSGLIQDKKDLPDIQMFDLSKFESRSFVNDVNPKVDQHTKIPYKTLDAFLALMLEETDFCFKVNKNVYPNYNLQNDDFMICYQSINDESLKCFFNHINKEEKLFHPGMKPPVYKFKDKIFVRCQFVEDGDAFDKAFKPSPQEGEIVIDKMAEEAISIDDIIDIINNVNNEDKPKNNDNEGEGE